MYELTKRVGVFGGVGVDLLVGASVAYPCAVQGSDSGVVYFGVDYFFGEFGYAFGDYSFKVVRIALCFLSHS